MTEGRYVPLLNYKPVVHENLCKIQCGQVISGINVKIVLAFFILLGGASFCSVEELDFLLTR